MPHTNKASAPVSVDIPEFEALNATMTVVEANLAAIAGVPA